MKNKIFITIFLNIIFIIISVFTLDLLFVYYKNNSYIIKNKFRLLPHTAANYSDKARDTISGPAEPDNPSPKKPIIISGCSIAYGIFLPFKDTLGYKLSQLTGRTVYNRGMSSTCISHVLYELTKTNIYDNYPSPDYFFFIYDPALHSERVNTLTFNPTSQIEYLRYKLKNEELKISGYDFVNIPYISSLSLYRHLMFNANVHNVLSNYNKKLTTALFKETNKQIHRIFPNTKFIVIIYEGNMREKDLKNKFYKDIIDEINANGIDSVSVNTLIDDFSNSPEYKEEDNIHPNSAFWNKFSGKLVQKYNL